MKVIIFLITLISFSNANIFFNAPNIKKRVTPNSKSEILSFYDRLKDVKKAVVNIATTKKIPVAITMEEYMLKKFYGITPQQKIKKSTYALGSGVIVNPNGYIITNHHVIAGADEIFVTLEDSQKTYQAQVIGSDEQTDIAVIKIKGKRFPYARFANSKNLKVGDIVFAIGNPFGLGESISMGIISALNKTQIGINKYENFIQTDASINPGNSGGALVDSTGALVGINSAIFSKSGGNNGIAFTIPSNMVKKIAKKLIKYGYIQRGMLGITISDLRGEYKKFYKHKNGVIVLDLIKNYPAYQAGLKRGDLIIKINGEDIKNTIDYQNKVGLYQVGDKLILTFERDGQLYQTEVVLTNPYAKQYMYYYN